MTKASKIPALNNSETARFWSKVNKCGDCWEWRAQLKNGYGYFRVRERMVMAHRVSYQIRFGLIPKDRFVLHRCDNPRCVRPSHLVVGTQADNLADMTAKGRRAKINGSKNPNARLTEKQVLAMRKMLTEGKSRSAVAAKFGVTESHVAGIETMASWTHI